MADSKLRGVDGVPVHVLAPHDVTIMLTTRWTRWFYGPVVLHHSTCPCRLGQREELLIGRREIRRVLGRG